MSTSVLCTLSSCLSSVIMSPSALLVMLVVPVQRITPQSTPSPCQQPSPITPTPVTLSKILLQYVLESPLDRTPTDAEKIAATCLLRIIINQQERCNQSGNILQLPTGGQVNSTI